MAENTNEEHLENPTNNQSENPPDEIFLAVATETINSNQETKIWKYIMPITKERKTGNPISGSF